MKVFAASALGSAAIMALAAGAGASPVAGSAAAPQALVLTSDTAPLPSIPAKGTAPAQVNSWWQGLTPDQQQQVTNSNPAAIGSLDGVPAAVRDYANRQVVSNLLSTDPTQADSLPNQIAGLTSQRDSLQSQLDNLPGSGPGSTAMAKTALSLQNQINNLNDQLDSAQSQLGGLQALKDKIDPNDPSGTNFQVPFPASDTPAAQPGAAPQMFLLGVDAPGAASLGSPNTGQFIVAAGNPDTAQNVATIVTGMDSKLDSAFVNYYVDAASNLQGQASVAAPGQTTSVITWYGYNAPQGVGNAAWTAPAVAAAPALQQFQAGLSATNADSSNLNSTVIGHSYGSVVVGEASQLTGGLDANQVAVVGSPGMNVASADAVAAGLNGASPGGSPQVFAGKNTTDIISLALGMGSTGLSVSGDTLGHGTDPTQPNFGATVFDAGNGQPGSVFNPSTGDLFGYSRAAHSEYFDWGNPALANLGNIVTGNSGAVTSQGTAALEQDLATGKYSGVLPPSLANELGIPVPSTPTNSASTSTPANVVLPPGDTGIDGIMFTPAPQDGTQPAGPVNTPSGGGAQPAAPGAGPGDGQQQSAPAPGAVPAPAPVTPPPAPAAPAPATDPTSGAATDPVGGISAPTSATAMNTTPDSSADPAPAATPTATPVDPIGSTDASDTTAGTATAGTATDPVGGTTGTPTTVADASMPSSITTASDPTGSFDGSYGGGGTSSG